MTLEIDHSKLPGLMKASTSDEAWGVLHVLARDESLESTRWVDWEVLFGGGSFGLLEHVAHSNASACFASLCALGFGFHWPFLSEPAKEKLHREFKHGIVKLCAIADGETDPPTMRSKLNELSAATAWSLRRLPRSERDPILTSIQNIAPLKASADALREGADMAASWDEKYEFATF